MPSLYRKLWKWTAGTFAALVILLALGLGIFRLVLDQIPDFNAQLARWIGDRAGLEIEFAQLDARWRLYGPELMFDDAVVRTPDGSSVLMAARHGSVGFDIWGFLTSGRITTGRFWLDAPQIALERDEDGRIRLIGQEGLPDRSDAFSFDSLPTGRFVVSEATVTFFDRLTGRGPWTFNQVGMTLHRKSDAMELRGEAELPSALGRQLRFSADTSGQLDVPTELKWDFAVEGDDIDLAALSDLLPNAWPAPETGTGTFEVAGTLQGATIDQLSGEFRVTQLALVLPTWVTPLPGPAPLRLRPSPAASGIVDNASADDVPAIPPELPPASAITQDELIAYDLVGGDFRVQRRDTGWHVAFDGLQLVRPGLRWDPSALEIDIARGESGGLAVHGTAEFLVLDSVWPLLAYVPESMPAARLRALDARGRLSNLRFSYEGARADTTPLYSVAAHMDDVAFAPVEQGPGLSGLTGDLLANDRGGRVQMDIHEFVFSLPRLFREPLAIDRFTGTVEWQRGADRWIVHSRDIRIEDADGRGIANLEVAIPDDRSSPILELHAEGHDLDATATSRYLPAGRLTARTLAWLDRAFTAGRVRDAQIDYRGPMRSFPFRNGEGTFVARAEIDGLTLDYNPQWSPVTEVQAVVTFLNQGLEATAESAKLHGLAVSAARVGIADFRQTELDIQATTAGDLSQMLTYLQQSPVGNALGQRFMQLEGRGSTTAQARLLLPIRQLAERKVDVTANLADAELGLRGQSERLTQINGPLQVLDKVLVSPGIAARFLNDPVSIVLAGDVDNATVVTANGYTSGANAQRLLNLPRATALSGATDWQLRARFPLASTNAGERVTGAQTYVVRSDLRGLGIGLPVPIGKTPEEVRPLQVEATLEGSDGMLLRGSLGDLRTVARLGREDEQWRLNRAGLRADGVAAALPDHAGLRIEGEVTRLDLDEWLRLASADSSAGRVAGAPVSRPISNILRGANVRVGDLELFGYRWADVRGLLQATATGWQVDVAGPQAAGQITIPYDLRRASAPLSMTMEKLVIGEREQAGTQQTASAVDPRGLPSINVLVNDLKLGVRELGTVRLELGRTAQGLDLKNLTAQSPAFNIEATGSWYAYDTPQGPPSVATTIAGTIASTDVGSALQAFGYGDIIAADRGLLEANLMWPGGPDAQALGRASGTVRIEMNDGQVVNLQPGAGRMLGLFSMAALPRRLSLDFSDLTDEGLAFDTVRGDFELKQGNAYTSNLLLSGPAAEIGIAGRTGLATHDYDQTAVVTGNIGATLPVAGALAGGPVVGAAMLLFSQVFKEPLKGITRGYYRITGPWDEPQVERVIASDSKEAAAQAQSSSIAATP